MNRKELLRRALWAKTRKKKKVTLYLEEEVYEKFRIYCAGYPASRVVSAMMVEFSR